MLLQTPENCYTSRWFPDLPDTTCLMPYSRVTARHLELSPIDELFGECRRFSNFNSPNQTPPRPQTCKTHFRLTATKQLLPQRTSSPLQEGQIHEPVKSDLWCWSFASHTTKRVSMNSGSDRHWWSNRSCIFQPIRVHVSSFGG